MGMLVFLASDHAGFKLKESVKRFLKSSGFEVRDFGAFSEKPCDYPDYVIPCCEAVAAGRSGAKGIVFGGTGIGECIAANKVKGIRAAIAFDASTARTTREHNDSNVLCLGGRTKTRKPGVWKKIVFTWLSTSFSNEERHKRRLKKISEYEKRKK